MVTSAFLVSSSLVRLSKSKNDIWIGYLKHTVIEGYRIDSSAFKQAKLDITINKRNKTKTLLGFAWLYSSPGTFQEKGSSTTRKLTRKLEWQDLKKIFQALLFSFWAPAEEPRIALESIRLHQVSWFCLFLCQPFF